MAKSKKKPAAAPIREVVAVEKPKSDVYTALLMLTLAATATATAVMYYENALLK